MGTNPEDECTAPPFPGARMPASLRRIRAIPLLLLIFAVCAPALADAAKRRKGAKARAAVAARAAAARQSRAETSPSVVEVAQAAPKTTRVDFDDRMIQGQTHSPGAVYLYDRKELPVERMVKGTTSFREQIFVSVTER
jgi:hypothetical protein